MMFFSMKKLDATPHHFFYEKIGCYPAPFFLWKNWMLPRTIFSMKKLKYFFIFILYGTVSTCSQNCISADFMVVPVSSGPRMLLILLFVVISSFTGRFLLFSGFLWSNSRLIFGRLFGTTSSLSCVSLTLPRIISRESVLVGFVFLLSTRFFPNFVSVIVSSIPWMLSVLLPMNLCATTGLFPWISTILSWPSSLGVPVLIPVVAYILSPRFRVLLLFLRMAVASSAALVLPTKSTGISFPSVSVSVTMRRFVSVLRVLIYLLMTRGSAPSDGSDRSGAVSKSAVYIYLRSILTAGVPDSTFFSDWFRMFERFGMDEFFHVHCLSIISKKNWILFSSIFYISPTHHSHLLRWLVRQDGR